MVRFLYTVISNSHNRQIHDEKKLWLESQGLNSDDYMLYILPSKNSLSRYYWENFNYEWCFSNPEIATAFKLKWKNDD
jgi:hypothetical protein